MFVARQIALAVAGLLAAPLLIGQTPPEATGERNAPPAESLLQGAPLTAEQVLFVLESGADPSDLQAMIAARGLTKPPSEQFRADLEALGAPPSFIETVANAAVRAPEQAAPALADGLIPLPVALAEDADLTARAGRLDLRIYVDGAEEVHVRGNQIKHKTLSGTQGRNAGTEYTQPLPERKLATLNVEKLDGRGEWTILQYPGQANGYEMILRIYDEKAGEDRYHLRFDWTLAE